MSRLWEKWDQFWFSPVDLRSLSLFRFIVGCGLLVMYILRFMDRDILLYEDGLVPSALAQEFLPEFYRSSLQWIPVTDTAVFWVQIIYLLGLGGVVLGLVDRVAMWVLLFLHLALMHRNFTVIYGADLVATFWLFYLGFAHHTQSFSVLRCLRSGRWTPREFIGWADGPKLSDLAGTVGVRLIQIQLCVIYGYTGLEKMKGTAWWEGSAVWKVFGNAQLAPMDFSFMAHWPLLVALMTLFTLIFEVYFPVVVWIPSLRKIWLFVGAAFHGGAAVLMGLPFFSLLMVSSYLVFWTPQQRKP